MKIKVRFSGVIIEADGSIKRLYNVYVDDMYVCDKLAKASERAKDVLNKIKEEKITKSSIELLDEIEEEIEVK